MAWVTSALRDAEQPAVVICYQILEYATLLIEEF